MAVNSPYAQYQQNAILNAKPEKLLILLLNGAVKFIKQADKALENKDIEGAHNTLVKVQDILAYLRGTLNPDYEIAQNLDALYDYIGERLVQANLKKDREILAEAGRMVEELRETWIQALTPKPAPDL
ncbi:MAG: flagellar export chaperone FliS [Candidatus Desulforudis sp.]|nr:flagellar export chaperone FliS [Desulforudis sp.]